MKKLIAILLLVVALVLVLYYYEDIEQMFHPGQSKIAGIWVNDADVAKYDFNSPYAAMNGDTYCKKCKKYIEGRVRICTFCGQYID